ncbi:uncharacterized [Tachysurus ichikawai]
MPAGLPHWVLSSTRLIVNLLISSFSIPPPSSPPPFIHNVPAQPGSAQAHGSSHINSVAIRSRSTHTNYTFLVAGPINEITNENCSLV